MIMPLRLKKSLLLLSSLFILGGQCFAAEDVVTLTYPGSDRAGELACEANYYLWLPPGVKSVRGVIVHQHGCGDGAERGCLAAAEDLHWRALAEKHGCALLGTSYRAGDNHCGAWADPRRGSHQRFLQALRDFAEKTKHPEIARAPWCLWGHSGGGWWASMMLVLEPERTVAVWLRSGSAYGGVLGPNKEAPPPVPAAALRVPVMGNPGAREERDAKFTNAYANTLGTFREWRARGALIGFAPDPKSNHDCGRSRYLAIPFFDACLEARLPRRAGAPLKPMPVKSAWLAPLLGDTAQPLAKFSGDTNAAVWLPNQAFAQAWSDYVKTTTVRDTTPPPAPFDVQARDGVLTWRARADFESGLRGFVVERDSAVIATLPEQQTERTVFQGLSFHDTPSQPSPPMRFTDPAPKAGAKYRVIAVNTAGWKSKPSAAIKMPAVKPPARETVIYGTNAAGPLTLDVFRPATNANSAGVLMIVSGGWASSRGAINTNYAAHFLARGYTVFAVVHGSPPQFHIPEIIPELYRAVRFIRFNAKKFGVDGNKLGVTGASSGGHLALILGTQGGPGAVGAGDLAERESSAVQAVACFFPPTDFLNYVRPDLHAMDESVLNNFRKFIGPIPDDVTARDALGRRISPLYSVSPHMAPALIIHGEKDQHVLLHQATSFVVAAKKAGGEAEVVIKQGQPHGWAEMGDDVEILAQWFDVHLSKTKVATPRWNKTK